MIDNHDADDFLWLSLLTDHPIISGIFLVLAIICFFVASCNEVDCSKKQCPNAAKPKLMENACLCVVEAK